MCTVLKAAQLNYFIDVIENTCHDNAYLVCAINQQVKGFKHANLQMVSHDVILFGTEPAYNTLIYSQLMHRVSITLSYLFQENADDRTGKDACGVSGCFVED